MDARAKSEAKTRQKESQMGEQGMFWLRRIHTVKKQKVRSDGYSAQKGSYGEILGYQEVCGPQ